jgi:hypothetical protein
MKGGRKNRNIEMEKGKEKEKAKGIRRTGLGRR